MPPLDVRLREVAGTDLPIIFENQLDPDAIRMVAFTSPDPTDRAAFMAHWRRILANELVVTLTVLVDGRVAGNVVQFDRTATSRSVTGWERSCRAVAWRHWRSSHSSTRSPSARVRHGSPPTTRDRSASSKGAASGSRPRSRVRQRPRRRRRPAHPDARLSGRYRRRPSVSTTGVNQRIQNRRARTFIDSKSTAHRSYRADTAQASARSSRAVATPSPRRSARV